MPEPGGHPPAPPADMETVPNTSLPYRCGKFALIFGLVCLFIYGFLPLLTGSVGILSKMAGYLDDNGIDPTRYYYTDVEQVKEAELYLQSVLSSAANEQQPAK